MNLAIIPARGGSTRIPRKNIRLFHGKPIIAYSIETARESRIFDEIVVSTDDQDIVAVAKGYGAKVHMRSAKLSQNDVGTQEVTRAAVNWWRVCHPNRQPNIVCCIYATAPMMTAEDLRIGLEIHRKSNRDYVYTMAQDETDAGQWYLGNAAAFACGVPLAGNSLPLKLAPERVCDINLEEDWQRAERMYAELHQPCKHEHKLIPTPDPLVPELACFQCWKCGHILPT